MGPGETRTNFVFWATLNFMNGPLGISSDVELSKRSLTDQKVINISLFNRTYSVLIINLEGPENRRKSIGHGLSILMNKNPEGHGVCCTHNKPTVTMLELCKYIHNVY